MLDLARTVKFTVYPIKLVDGSVLHIKQPTQAMLMKMVKMQDLLQEEDTEELLDAVYKLMTIIFNRNTDKKTFTQEELEEMLDLNTCLLVLQDYLTITLKKLGE